MIIRNFSFCYAVSVCLLFKVRLKMHFLVLLKLPIAGQNIKSELGGNSGCAISESGSGVLQDLKPRKMH